MERIIKFPSFFRLQLKSTQEELDRLRDEKGAAGERRRSSSSITRSKFSNSPEVICFCFKGNLNDVNVVFCSLQ